MLWRMKEYPAIWLNLNWQQRTWVKVAVHLLIWEVRWKGSLFSNFMVTGWFFNFWLLECCVFSARFQPKWDTHLHPIVDQNLLYFSFWSWYYSLYYRKFCMMFYWFCSNKFLLPLLGSRNRSRWQAELTLKLFSLDIIRPVILLETLVLSKVIHKLPINSAAFFRINSPNYQLVTEIEKLLKKLWFVIKMLITYWSINTKRYLENSTGC